MSVETVSLRRSGPFSFYDMDIPGPLLDTSGVYVLAYRFGGRFFAHCVGETGGTDVGRDKTFLNRLVDHRYGYMVGPYCRHDPQLAEQCGRLPKEVETPREDTRAASGLDVFGDAWVKALSVFLAPVQEKSRAEL